MIEERDDALSSIQKIDHQKVQLIEETEERYRQKIETLEAEFEETLAQV
jgi:hypothetical protein